MANYKTPDGTIAIWIPETDDPNMYGSGLILITDEEAAAIMAPKPVVPDVISDRQFFQQLAIEGKITEEEAIAAVATGTIPAAMSALIPRLPIEAQFPAKMVLSGATSFERNHPLTGTLGGMYGMDSAALDAFWMNASRL